MNSERLYYIILWMIEQYYRIAKMLNEFRFSTANEVKHWDSFQLEIHH